MSGESVSSRVIKDIGNQGNDKGNEQQYGPVGGIEERIFFSVITSREGHQEKKQPRTGGMLSEFQKEN